MPYLSVTDTEYQLIKHLIDKVLEDYEDGGNVVKLIVLSPDYAKRLSGMKKRMDFNDG